MEKHACKLCFRSFANGRALGGHMRSHVTSSAASNKPIKDSPSSSFSSSKAPVNVAANNGSLAYRLRENPKKSTRLMIVQDYESDAESGHDRRRSKRARRSLHDSEPASSLSTASMEEDVAISLMMLSRDIWHKSDEGVLSDDDDEEEIKVDHPKRSCKYQCGTCKKVFRSYQALGGHRASHKKTNGCAPPPPVKIHDAESVVANNDNNSNNVERTEHQCPVCYRIFSSGQALGGHKRSHLTANPVSKSNRESWIDLNLPAPIEDDAELSAVFDA